MSGTPWVRLQLGKSNDQESHCLARAKAPASSSYPQSVSLSYPKAKAIGFHEAFQ